MDAITKVNNFELKLNKLDDSQYCAVTSKSDNILLKAPAGSGKTFSILSAVSAYRYEN